jgi:ADP-heptose:LPS heptosyltransferase
VNAGSGSILVIRGGAIGDFILTLPVLTALRAQFPGCRLEVLGYPHIAQLAPLGRWADAVRSIEARPLAGFFARHGELDAELAEYFAGFAVILSFLYDPDDIFRENIARCSPALFIVGPHRPEEARHLHATEVFLKPLERLAIYGADPVPRLDVKAVAGAPAPLEPGCGVPPPTTLALHPGSGSERKNWPEANWRAFVQTLVETTAGDLLLVGGEAEADRLHRLAALVPEERRQIADHLPLAEVARRLAVCRAFVGHDSGITHLAAAVGLPGLVLWGESNEALWRPKSDRMILLRATDGLANLSVSTVLSGLSELLTGGAPSAR